MTNPIEFLGTNDVNDRSLFLLDIPSMDAIPAHIELGSRYFACFIDANAQAIPNEIMLSAARVLIRNGAAYVSTWGEGCENVHDIVDEAMLEFDPDPTDESVIMTT